MINERKPQEFKLFSSKWRESSNGEIVCDLDHQHREEDNERLCKMRIGIQKVSPSLYEAMIYLNILYGKDPNDHIRLNFSVKIGSLNECFQYLDDYLQHICLDHDKNPKRYECRFFTKNEKNELEELSEHSFTFDAKYSCIVKKVAEIYGEALLSQINRCYYQTIGHFPPPSEGTWSCIRVLADPHLLSFVISGSNKDKPGEDRLLVVVYE
jgi:hypothetical protein